MVWAIAMLVVTVRAWSPVWYAMIVHKMSVSVFFCFLVFYIIAMFFFFILLGISILVNLLEKEGVISPRPSYIYTSLNNKLIYYFVVKIINICNVVYSFYNKFLNIFFKNSNLIIWIILFLVFITKIYFFVWCIKFIPEISNNIIFFLLLSLFFVFLILIFIIFSILLDWLKKKKLITPYYFYTLYSFFVFKLIDYTLIKLKNIYNIIFYYFIRFLIIIFIRML